MAYWSPRAGPTGRVRWIRRALGILVAAPVVWSFIEPSRLVIVGQDVHPPRWPGSLAGLRIVLLGDLHTGSPWTGLDKIARVVRETNALQPDLVVLLGDYVVHGVPGGTFVPPEDTARALSGLVSSLGTIAVLGNHDWWLDGGRVGSALRSAGIRVLENDAVRLRYRGSPLWIGGLADLWTRTPEVTAVLKRVTGPGPVVMLTHSPDVFPAIPDAVSLTLAAHTHGGQIAVPWLGPPVVPSAYGRRYARGLIEERGRQIFVTSGIGTSILPVRFMVPPEIAILTLHP